MFLNNIKRYLKYILIISCFALISGCAGSPVKDGFVIKGPDYYIAGHSYTALDCVISAYSLKSSWDLTGRTIILQKNNSKIFLAVESDIALIDDVPYKLKCPVILQKSRVLVPRDFAERVLSGIFIKKSASEFYKSSDTPPCPGTHIIKRVVLDPGHGGKDPGAVGKSGLREKEVVLDITKRLKRLLESQGLDVRLTRESDVFISLWKRADIANKLEADFFISIHANAARSRYANGFEVFYLSDAVDDNARAIAAAENASLKYEDSSFGSARPSNSLEATLWDIAHCENRRESIGLGRHITDTACKDLGVKNRGVKGANFYVLKGARMPSVLVEVGFISNIREERLLKDNAYREKIARSIAGGIIKYKDEYEQAEGFTKQR